MKKFVTYILIGILTALPVAAMAQMQNTVTVPGTLLDNPIKRTFSLLDPQRLKIRHAYSLSYFSGGSNSGTVGMYLSTIQYQIARPLTLRVGLIYAHNPLSMFGRQTGGIVREGIYPSFYLDYRPSSNFYLGIGFQRVPGYRYAAPRYYGPWWDAPADWWRTK